MTSVGVVTCSRSEYSTVLPVLQAIQSCAGLHFRLIVGGMHLRAEFGLSIREIEADGFEIHDRVDFLDGLDSEEAVAKSIGLGTVKFAEAFARNRPDVLLVAGDRLELLAVACAALPLRIPIAHLSGGDVSEGAVDNQVRHALTKMSNLHFVAMEEHAERVRQMGEEPWRVFVTGDPALDLLQQMNLLTREELSRSLGIPLARPLVVVTLHPVTLSWEHCLPETEEVLSVFEGLQGTLVFTGSNADPEGLRLNERIREFAAIRPDACFFPNLGHLKYYSLLSHADLMVGNSSSAIWEAPSFSLPAVNIGDRQKGRKRAENVIDARQRTPEIRSAIQRALEPSFRDCLRHMKNPYGDGNASMRIIRILSSIEFGPRLMQKSFSSTDYAIPALERRWLGGALGADQLQEKES